MRKLLRLLLGLCLAVTLVVLLGAAGIAVLRWRGLILGPDQRDPQEWEVFGVDVSTYQGKVDWPVLARQGVTSPSSRPPRAAACGMSALTRTGRGPRRRVCGLARTIFLATTAPARPRRRILSPPSQ